MSPARPRAPPRATRPHDQAELVAAQARDQDTFRHVAAQPVGDLGQHLVLAGVADRVLHLVEAPRSISATATNSSGRRLASECSMTSRIRWRFGRPVTGSS